MVQSCLGTCNVTSIFLWCTNSPHFVWHFSSATCTTFKSGPDFKVSHFKLHQQNFGSLWSLKKKFPIAYGFLQSFFSLLFCCIFFEWEGWPALSATSVVPAWYQVGIWETHMVCFPGLCFLHLCKGRKKNYLKF